MFPGGDDEERAGPIVPAGVHLAPLWRRVVGLAIDQLLVAAPVLAAFAAAGHPPGEALDGDTMVWSSMAMTGVAMVYETIGVWRWGRTIGKWAMGTKVVHVADGGSVVASSALLRALVPAAFGVVPEVGPILSIAVYLLAFFDPRRQGLHDKAAGTLVGQVRG
ncbi:MAG TPA: hypothetical protein DCR14_02465 [Acidimicrobiaceae bacterium]|nr:hypothetical protein [Acidimicrobiaceae bacterium]